MRKVWFRGLNLYLGTRPRTQLCSYLAFPKQPTSLAVFNHKKANNYF